MGPKEDIEKWERIERARKERADYIEREYWKTKESDRLYKEAEEARQNAERLKEEERRKEEQKKKEEERNKE